MPEQPPQALEGVKVLDLTHHVAGPFCTRYLADFGADVVKVERPGAGDPARRFGPFFHDEPHPEKSAVFLFLSLNKRGITLDLKATTGRGILLRLASWADVLVEGFRPGAMASLGLGYAALSQANPRLVMVSVSNFGQDGPYRDFLATEMLLSAIGGPMHGTGTHDREPSKYASTVALRQAGLAAAAATVTALYAAEETGRGSHVDLSILETQAGSQDRVTNRLLGHQHTGEVFQRDTVGTTTATGTWPCKDGYISLRADGARFPLALQMIGRSDLLQDPRFGNIVEWSRPENADAFNHDYLLPWLLERTRQEVWEAAQAMHILSGPINTAADVLADPHFRVRGVWPEVDHPATGPVTYPGRPFVMNATPWRLRRPAPTLGQHNREVYCDMLGYSLGDLAALRAAGVV